MATTRSRSLLLALLLLPSLVLGGLRQPDAPRAQTRNPEQCQASKQTANSTPSQSPAIPKTLQSPARLYLPELGIYAQRDPMEGVPNLPITFNPYLIGHSNPSRWLDPDGRCSELCAQAYIRAFQGDLEANRYLQRQHPNISYSIGGAQSLAATAESAIIAPAALAGMIGGTALEYAGLRSGNQSSDQLGALLAGGVNTASGIYQHGPVDYGSIQLGKVARAFQDAGERGDLIEQARIGTDVVTNTAMTVAGGVTAYRALRNTNDVRVIQADPSGAGVILVDADGDWRRIAEPEPVRKGSSYNERFKQTPVNGGWWSGVRGESTFYSHHPDVVTVTRDAGVDYTSARPDFSPYTAAEVRIEAMSTSRRANFARADSELATQMGVPRSEVTRWREQNSYTWHEDNTTTMQLVPTAINARHGHLGGVGEIKRMQQQETPQ